MNAPPELPPATTEPAPPPKPGPIDVAVSALSEAAAELLASARPSRFAEIQSIAVIAMQLQRMRPGIGVDDLGDYEPGDGMQAMPARHHRRGVPVGFNDGADLNREILMLAQTFLAQYAEAEKKRADRPDPDVRLNEVGELAELYGLRLKLALADQDVPVEINARILYLLQRVGAPAPNGGPPHEPAPDSLVFAHDVRGREADGPGERDRGGVGGALAERAAGDDGAR